MNKILPFFIQYICLAFFWMSTLCFGHDWPVHMRITENAFESSAGLQSFLSENLESQRLMASQPQVNGNNFTPTEWLQLGSRMEDEQLYGAWTLRPVDHFYTVIPYRTAGQVIGLTDKSEPWPWGYFLTPNGITNSFVWASQNEIQGPFIQLGNAILASAGVGAGAIVPEEVGTNVYNWYCARTYQFAALTNSLQSDRNENMALMLYTLGHILHLNQDLSQPDHVRNDNHYNKDHRYIENYGVQNYAKNSQWFALPYSATVGWANWRSKGFSKLLDFWDRGLYADNSSYYLNQEAGGNVKLGLAEWSNGNFLGEDALYNEVIGSDMIHSFPFPSLKTSTSFGKVRTALGYGVRTVLLKDGEQVNRVYLDKTGDGITFSNHSALTYLGVRNRGGQFIEAATTLNDSNVLQAYHNILIHKAVEYSAGILDYFFRGDMVVSVAHASETYTITVMNFSGQDFIGGAFSLFSENSSGERTLVQPNDFTGGTLSDGGATTITYSTTLSETTKFILVYQGTIVKSGTTPDPVDAGIGIAAITFHLDPSNPDNPCTDCGYCCD